MTAGLALGVISIGSLANATPAVTDVAAVTFYEQADLNGAPLR